MRIDQSTSNRSLWLCPLISVLAATMSGCCACGDHAIPASCLPQELRACRRSGSVPIDLTLLRQQPPPGHIIGPHDVLGVYIQDVVPLAPNEQEPQVANLQVVTAENYYPPMGLIRSPAVGLPMEVSSEGTLQLPFIPPLKLDGLTIEAAIEKIRRAYTVERRLVKPGHERIFLSLIRPRVERIIVIRDDVLVPGPTYQPQGRAALLTRRGTGQLVDLPPFENDVMHALAVSGGLPGIDAYAAVWIYRERPATGGPGPLPAPFPAGAGRPDAATFAESGQTAHSRIRIPLRVCPGEPLPFTADDIILHSGDVVYLESRQTEYFFSGGLLIGGQVPLPRDYDLDVVGAVALATGSVGGPPGGPDSAVYNFRAGGVGNIVPPSRVLIQRKAPNGDLVEIRVDLNRAKHDPCERIIIMPGDVVSLNYTFGETMSNLALNLVTFNVAAVFNR